MNKAQRQHRITELIQNEALASQHAVMERLTADGIDVTQATVSRDLEDIGAVKVRIPGGHLVYGVPEHANQRVAPEEHVRRVMSEFVVEVGASANLVIIRTPPGSAHVVASAIDRGGVEGVLGSVAGDDTILVVASASTTGEALAQHFAMLAGIDPASTPHG
ncbi:MAG: arginine repressor [Acidimicrobiia bacterium]